jgi:septum formation protein
MKQKRPRIILASISPRRAELLRGIGLEFDVVSSNVPERPHPGESPRDYITRVAHAKVMTVASSLDSGLVIGADTTVVIDDEILEKPRDDQDAARMIQKLSGKWHVVLTAVSVYDVQSQKEAVGLEETKVEFARLTDQEIDWYVGTGEPMDKAGAYGIQGYGGLFVERIAGNYYNVVGLPLPLVYRLCSQLGYSLLPNMGL